MSALLADDSFWNADVTPNPSPVKAPPKTPPKRPCETRKTLPKIDYSNLLDGIDDWDVDFVSPQKPKKAQTKVVINVNRRSFSAKFSLSPLRRPPPSHQDRHTKEKHVRDVL